MIPKILHLCWLSGDPYPELIARCVDSWKAVLPDYRVMIWDTKSFDVHSVPWVEEAFDRRKFAFAADFIRLHALHLHGGIYLDADVEVIRRPDALLSYRSFLGYDSAGDLELAVIGSEPGSEWIGRCLDHYRERHFVRSDGTLDMYPLPLLVADILQESYPLPSRAVDHPTLISGAKLTLFPARYFSPKNARTGKVSLSADTLTVHHFDGQWLDKDWRFRAKSIVHAAMELTLGKAGHRKMVECIRRWSR